MTTKCLDNIPDIHSCTTLLLENAQLKKRLRKLRAENQTLKDKLTEMTERQKIENLMRQYVTTHNMQTQTETTRPQTSTLHVQRKKESEKQAENERTNKLLAMHNGLMRRYEKELKNSMQNVETITELQLKVNSLEQKLKEAELRCQEAESKQRYQRRPTTGHRGHYRSFSSDEDDEYQRMKDNLKKMKKDNCKLKEENKKIKTELRGLDAGFFEEVEDLKYALQQADQLNKRYEQSLRRVCAKFGQPYPHPEKSLQKPIT